MGKMQIKELRQEAGYTQTELAKAMGVSSVAVVYWEQGDLKPKAERLPKLASLLNCTIEELFTGRRTVR